MEVNNFQSLCSHSLIMLMVLGIQNIGTNENDVYYITDGIKTKNMSCYPCPAGREPMHECWKTYTKEEDKNMSRECQLCNTEFYKELPVNKDSYSKCIPCVSCFGFIIIRDCDPRHGRTCGDECAVDFYKIDFECRECCHCTTGDVKEKGCRNSPSKKFCGSDKNGKCKQQPQIPTSGNTRPSLTMTTAQITRRRSTSSPFTSKTKVPNKTKTFSTPTRSTKERPSQITLFTKYSTKYSELKTAKVTTARSATRITVESRRLTTRTATRIPVKSRGRSAYTTKVSSKHSSTSSTLPSGSRNSSKNGNGLSGGKIAAIAVASAAVIIAIMMIVYVRKLRQKDGSRSRNNQTQTISLMRCGRGEPF